MMLYIKIMDTCIQKRVYILYTQTIRICKHTTIVNIRNNKIKYPKRYLRTRKYLSRLLIEPPTLRTRATSKLTPLTTTPHVHIINIFNATSLNTDPRWRCALNSRPTVIFQLKSALFVLRNARAEPYMMEC